jgi:hypothetical protein
MPNHSQSTSRARYASTTATGTSSESAEKFSLEGETREHRHEEHGTAALPLEYHEQAPEQRDVDDRQHVLRPDLAAVQHRPRCGREEGGGSEPDERAEARPEDDVREADRDDREHTDERSRRERVVTKTQWNRQ